MLTNRLTPQLLFEASNDKGGEGSADESKGKKSPVDIMPDADVDALRNEIRSKRDSEAKYRKKAKELESSVSELSEFKKKVEGFFGDNDDDPEKQITGLKSENESLKTVNQKLKTKQAIRSHCAKYGGDAEMLIPHILIKEDVDDLEKTVKTLIEENDKFKNGQAKKAGDETENGSNKKPISINQMIREKVGS